MDREELTDEARARLEAHETFLSEAESSVEAWKKIADEQMQTAEMREDASFDWGAWGPYDNWWGPGAVVAVRARR